MRFPIDKNDKNGTTWEAGYDELRSDRQHV